MSMYTSIVNPKSIAWMILKFPELVTSRIPICSQIPQPLFFCSPFCFSTRPFFRFTSPSLLLLPSSPLLFHSYNLYIL